MDEQLSGTIWNKTPDYDPISNGRIRVSRSGRDITWFRKGIEARLPVRNLQNTGTCPFAVLAIAEDSTGTIKVLKSADLIPRERLSTFFPPLQTMYLTIVHLDDDCPGTAILECDDIPRV